MVQTYWKFRPISTTVSFHQFHSMVILTFIVVFVFWQQIDDTSSFMKVNTAPLLTVSMFPGETLYFSMKNGISGAFAGIYNHETTLTPDGQINNLWGEISTGPHGTFDVTAEVNMAGNSMNIQGPGCTADTNRCVYKCYTGNVCLLSLLISWHLV